MNDLKFALRQVLKYPGFTAVAVLTLAIGIGATTSISCWLNALVLKPLPFRDADQLVFLELDSAFEIAGFSVGGGESVNVLPSFPFPSAHRLCWQRRPHRDRFGPIRRNTWPVSRRVGCNSNHPLDRKEWLDGA